MIKIGTRAFKLHQLARRHRGKFISTIFRRLNAVLFNFECCPQVWIHPSTRLVHNARGCFFGGNTKIGKNCCIFPYVTITHDEDDWTKYPTIGNNVTICTGAIIIGDVHIPDNTIIKYGEVIRK